MRNEFQQRKTWIRRISSKLRKLIRGICSVEPSQVSEMATLTPRESLAARDYSSSISSSLLEEYARKPETGNIEEAETSLRERGSLNYEEARALLGRYEYQKGNIEAALHVFEGIDVSSVTVKLKIALSRLELPSRPLNDFASSPLSMHAVGLLFEAFFLKAKSLEALRRYRESAKSCSVILDIVESSLPAGFPEKFGADCKLQEILNKAVELLPELWKFADSPSDAIFSYRRALLHPWNLHAKTMAKIEKDFATFLLYSEPEFFPPSLRSQIDSAFVPKNNIEEAILLLKILLSKVILKRIEWDPTILDHLSYALSISGGLGALANQVEGLFPVFMDGKRTYNTLALCYQGDGRDSEAVDLWEKLLSTQPRNIQALLFLAKICAGSSKFEDGMRYSKRAIEISNMGCNESIAAAHLMNGISYSGSHTDLLTDNERHVRRSEAIKCLEKAGKLTKMKDGAVLYYLALEYAEQRNLDAALHNARVLLKLERGSNIGAWFLLARILSAQKSYSDAENVINEAIDQAGIWDQGVLLRTKAKLQLAQGLEKEVLDTYSRLLAIIQVQRRTSEKNLKDLTNNLELAAWHDLALIYIKFRKWNDAEICISKLASTSSNPSALRWHAAGSLYEARGRLKEAMEAYHLALAVDHEHVPSLVSMATALRKEGCRSPAVLRSFLMEALRLDRMNASAWYILGQLYADEGDGFSSDVKAAAECFQASAFLQETEPIEPFR